MDGSFWCASGRAAAPSGTTSADSPSPCITPGTVSPPRLRPNSRPSIEGGTYIEPDMTMRSASCSSACDELLGTKPMAPLSMARMTSLVRSDADTTTTGTAG